MKRVYVCAPYSMNPKVSQFLCTTLAREIYKEGHLPIAPQIYLHQFVSEEDDRRGALSLCLELLALCTEVRVYGTVVSEGMQLEIERAAFLQIPVKYVDMVIDNEG